MIEHKIKVERRQLEFLLTAPEFVGEDGVHVLQQIAQVSNQTPAVTTALTTALTTAHGLARCECPRFVAVSRGPFCTYIHSTGRRRVHATDPYVHIHQKVSFYPCLALFCSAMECTA